jgi:hypothetical protein
MGHRRPTMKEKDILIIFGMFWVNEDIAVFELARHFVSKYRISHDDREMPGTKENVKQ